MDTVALTNAYLKAQHSLESEDCGCVAPLCKSSLPVTPVTNLTGSLIYFLVYALQSGRTLLYEELRSTEWRFTANMRRSEISQMIERTHSFKRTWKSGVKVITMRLGV